MVVVVVVVVVVEMVEEGEEVLKGWWGGGGGLCEGKWFQFVYTSGEPPSFVFVPPFFDSNE